MKKNIKKFALVHAWELTELSAERELIGRFEAAADKINFECLNINRNGYVYNSNFKLTNTHISNIKNVKFVIHMHFDSFKCYDIWSIFPLWNPPKFIMDWNDPILHVEYIINHDDYALSTSLKTVNYLNSILSPYCKKFDGEQRLFPSLCSSQMLYPKINLLDEIHLFYCGISWECTTNKEHRHEKLFKKLDAHEFVDFYGPYKIHGRYPWKKFKNYRGEIPFDGSKSLLATINNSGISLALSSPEHIRADVISNRLFESIAAGSLVITNQHEFVEKNFKDSVFQLENTSNSEQLYNKILEIYNWADLNPQQAQEKACIAQEIFKENFCLENMLRKITKDLPSRMEAFASKLYSLENSNQIQVVILWTIDNTLSLSRVINSIKSQNFLNFSVCCICDIRLKSSISKILSEEFTDNFKIRGIKLFSWSHDGDINIRLLTTGQVLSCCISEIDLEYVTFITPFDIWFHDHLTILKRKLDDNHKYNVACCLQIEMSTLNNKEHFSYKKNSRLVSDSTWLLNNFSTELSVGGVLIRAVFFKKLAEKYFPEVIFYTDYSEFYVILLIAKNEDCFILSPMSTQVSDCDSRKNATKRLVYSIETQRKFVECFLFGWYQNKMTNLDQCFVLKNKKNNGIIYKIRAFFLRSFHFFVLPNFKQRLIKKIFSILHIFK